MKGDTVIARAVKNYCFSSGCLIEIRCVVKVLQISASECRRFSTTPKSASLLSYQGIIFSNFPTRCKKQPLSEEGYFYLQATRWTLIWTIFVCSSRMGNIVPEKEKDFGSWSRSHLCKFCHWTVDLTSRASCGELIIIFTLDIIRGDYHSGTLCFDRS